MSLQVSLFLKFDQTYNYSALYWLVHSCSGNFVAHTQFGSKTTLASHSLWPQAYLGLRHILARGILWLKQYFGLMPTLARIYLGSEQLRPENQIFKSVILPGNKLKNLPCKGKRHQFNIYKPMFSIKARFLIWNYQAWNNSYKLVTRMATNLAC